MLGVVEVIAGSYYSQWREFSNVSVDLVTFLPATVTADPDLELDFGSGNYAWPVREISCSNDAACDRKASIVQRHPRTSTESQPQQRSETERGETCQQAETLDPRPPIRQTVKHLQCEKNDSTWRFAGKTCSDIFHCGVEDSSTTS